MSYVNVNVQSWLDLLKGLTNLVLLDFHRKWTTDENNNNFIVFPRKIKNIDACYFKTMMFFVYKEKRSHMLHIWYYYYVLYKDKQRSHSWISVPVIKFILSFTGLYIDKEPLTFCKIIWSFLEANFRWIDFLLTDFLFLLWLQDTWLDIWNWSAHTALHSKGIGLQFGFKPHL